jgi:hypothetical protein
MRKNKHINKIIRSVFIISLIGVFSCSSFLEQEPGSQTSITEQLSTKSGVFTALLGSFSNIESNIRAERFSIYADVLGGNLKFTPTITGNNAGQIAAPINLENVYSFQDQAITSDLESFYDANYEIANQANLILEYVDALTDANDEEKAFIKAQAYAIRGYAHYLLTLIYSQNYGFTDDASHLGIVYNTSTLTNGITYPARENLANTYQFIIEDFLSALENFSNNTFTFEGPSYSYFNPTNTQALLARVYLYKNDWQNAYNLANIIILNSGITLMPSNEYISEWEKPDSPVSEILLEFSIPRDDGGSVGGSLSQFFGYNSKTDYEKYVASEDLINLFEANDIRRNLFLEESLPTLINENMIDVTYYFTKKFQDNPGFVAMRLSEIYLIRAEASLELNRLDDCKDDLNIIRQRANASLITDTNNLEEALLIERRKELCFEGHYFFDLARKQKDIVRNDGCISQTCNLSYPSPKFVLPIPQSNLNLNTNLQQNESY